MRHRIPPTTWIVLGVIGLVAGMASLVGDSGDAVQGVIGIVLGLLLVLGGVRDRQRGR
jgi:hypothetical protein